MGQIEEIIYVSFEDTERVFEKEWLNLRGDKQ